MRYKVSSALHISRDIHCHQRNLRYCIHDRLKIGVTGIVRYKQSATSSVLPRAINATLISLTFEFYLRVTEMTKFIRLLKFVSGFFPLMLKTGLSPCPSFFSFYFVNFVPLGVRQFFE